MRLPAQIARMAVAFLMAPALLHGQHYAAGSSTSEPQTPEAASASPSLRISATTVPRFEVFLGYSGIRAVPTDTLGNRLVWFSGGSASAAFNLNRYLGIVADFGGYRDTRLRLTGAGANPAGTADSSGSAYTYLLGPRFSYRKQRFTPFAQALFGAAHASEVTLKNCSGLSCPQLPAENAFALTAGGGVDLKIRGKLSVRLVQAEYMMTRFADLTTGDRQMQNDVRLSSGLVFGLGSITPPAPITYSCSATPASVYPGEPVTVTGTAANLNPKRTPQYNWTSDGGKISGNTATATVDSTTAAPGSYRAIGHVSDGSKAGQSADCSASYTVLAFQPPTVSCSVNPSTVHPGDSVSVQAQANSPQQRPLTYSYSASAGSVSGSTPSATLSTTGVGPGPVTVTCNVVDDKGQSASANAVATVEVLAAAPAPVTAQLCSIDFARDPALPTRVSNEAKACLDDVALNMQRSSDVRLAMIGHGDLNEAAQRAVNAKDYLVTDKGIDASRIVVYTGHTDGKTVENILIPLGATLDQTNLSPVDVSVKAIPRKALRKSSKRRRR